MRLSRKLRVYLRAGPTAAPERVRKADVLARLERGVWINVLGLASTLLGLQVCLLQSELPASAAWSSSSTCLPMTP